VTTVKTLDQKMKELSPARRRKITGRAARLATEEMSLREVRKARRLDGIRPRQFSTVDR
jgi:hypothetical protein